MANLQYVSARKFIESLETIGPLDSVALSLNGNGEIVAGKSLSALDRSFDFGTERFVPRDERDTVLDNRSIVPSAKTIEPKSLSSGRASGHYTIEVLGEARSYSNLKHLLAETVEILSENDPSLMQRLSQEKARTRRLVARKPELLFDKPHLAKDHAFKLRNGWWLNTNNSRDQVKRWLNVIARHANLSWNQDIRISF